MSFLTPKIQAKWKEPVAFRRARADYEKGRPIDLRRRAVIAFGAMGAVAGLAFHFTNELIRHPQHAAALAGIALVVGVFYVPLRGWLLANGDATVRLNKTHIERIAAFGLEKEKWEIKAMKEFHFVEAENCEVLRIEMQDGSQAYFGVPWRERPNVQNNLRVALKDARM